MFVINYFSTAGGSLLFQIPAKLAGVADLLREAEINKYLPTGN